MSSKWSSNMNRMGKQERHAIIGSMYITRQVKSKSGDKVFILCRNCMRTEKTVQHDLQNHHHRPTRPPPTPTTNKNPKHTFLSTIMQLKIEHWTEAGNARMVCFPNTGTGTKVFNYQSRHSNAVLKDRSIYIQ